MILKHDAKIRDTNLEWPRDILDPSPEQLTSVGFQEDFLPIKGSVPKVKLPPDLRLRRGDQQTLAVISKSRLHDTQKQL